MAKKSKVAAAFIAAIMLILILSPGIARSDAKRQFGHFVEIRKEKYLNDKGVLLTEYMVYDRMTNLVYMYTTDGNAILSITPYMMRDYYGQITVGLYNKETGGIEPAELSRFVEDDEWDLTAKKKENAYGN